MPLNLTLNSNDSNERSQSQNISFPPSFIIFSVVHLSKFFKCHKLWTIKYSLDKFTKSITFWVLFFPFRRVLIHVTINICSRYWMSMDIQNAIDEFARWEVTKTRDGEREGREVSCMCTLSSTQKNEKKSLTSNCECCVIKKWLRISTIFQ